MKKFGLLMYGLVFCFSLGVLMAQDNEDVAENFMKPKLYHSQEILKGVMERDYKTVMVSANKIKELSKDEQFHVLLTAEYVKHNDALTKAADQLAKDAKTAWLGVNNEGQSEKLLKDYTVMLDSCVKCHNYMRDRK